MKNQELFTFESILKVDREGASLTSCSNSFIIATISNYSGSTIL